MPEIRLRTLFGNEEDADVSLILVPGPYSNRITDWAILNSYWKSFLASTDSKVHIGSFPYRLEYEDDYSARQIAESGKVLLACLIEQQAAQRGHLPLVFVCYSFGCCVLKQAMCIADSTNQSVLHRILGIVFLGDPQLLQPSDKATEQWSLIVQSVLRQKLSKQFKQRLRQDLHVLRSVSLLFQDIEFKIDILSLYERDATKVKTKGYPWFRGACSSFHVQPGPEKRRGLKEDQGTMAGDHAALCRLEGDHGEANAQLSHWLSSILDRPSVEVIRRRMSTVLDSNIATAGSAALPPFCEVQQAITSIDAQKQSEVTSMSPAVDSSKETDPDMPPLFEQLQQPRKNPRLPCFMMEALTRNANFYGRSDILALLDIRFLQPCGNDSLLSAERKTGRNVVLCGMGGIGKTSIAVEYVYSRRDRFDAIFWVRANDDTKTEQDVTQIAYKLGLASPSDNLSPLECRELALGWLSNPRRLLDASDDIMSHREARWLLVFDNADTPEVLQDFSSVFGCGSILVTSRNPFSGAMPVTETTMIALSPMVDVEATELLEILSCNQQNKELAALIAKELGGLPLAISQMAAIIRFEFWTFADFLERYKNTSDRQRLYAFDYLNGRKDVARGNVASIWAVEQLNAEARSLLQVFSMLDCDCIQEEVVEPYQVSGRRSITAPIDQGTYLRARAQLLGRSLLTRNAGAKAFRMHRVLQEIVREQMSASSFREVYHKAVSLIMASWGETPLAKRHDRHLSQARSGLFPHAVALQQLYERLPTPRWSNDQDAMTLASLMNEAAWWQHERGASQEAKSLWSLCLDICTQTDSARSNELLADAHYGLCAAASETNDPQSCLFHTEALLSLRVPITSLQGRPDIRLAVAFNEHGQALAMNKRYKESIEAFVRSIGIFGQLEEHFLAIDTNPRMNLGFIHWILGEYSTAYYVLTDLLKDRQRQFGVNDSESYRTGRVLHGIGNILFDQQRQNESQSYHLRALNHYQRTLGDLHHKTADLYYRVAQHALRRGEYGDARTLLDRALRVWRYQRTEFLPQIARATFLKSKLLQLTGNAEEATAKLETAIQCWRRITGNEPKAAELYRESDFEEHILFTSR